MKNPTPCSPTMEGIPGLGYLLVNVEKKGVLKQFYGNFAYLWNRPEQTL